MRYAVYARYRYDISLSCKRSRYQCKMLHFLKDFMPMSILLRKNGNGNNIRNEIELREIKFYVHDGATHN